MCCVDGAWSGACGTAGRGQDPGTFAGAALHSPGVMLRTLAVGVKPFFLTHPALDYTLESHT